MNNIDELMALADTYADGPHLSGYYGAHRNILHGAIEQALADAYDTGMRKGSVWGLAKVQPQEFCCEASWRDAKELAWKQVQSQSYCGCDHNASCLKCWPRDFRAGGKWDAYKPATDLHGKAQERKEQE